MYLVLECLTTKLGFGYVGTMNVTQRGIACQNWSSTSPHIPLNIYPKEEHNYCRNFYSDMWINNYYMYDDTPWCYTMSNITRWDYCDIPACGKYLGL